MIDTWAPRVNISKSKLMLPMAYALIIGGEGSLIGSTLNIVALSQAKESDNWDGEDVRFFEFGYVSLPLFVISIIYVVLLSPSLLKSRPQNETSVRDAAKDYWAVFFIPEGSWMVGNTLDLSGVTRCPQVTLREIERNLRPMNISDSKNLYRFYIPSWRLPYLLSNKRRNRKSQKLQRNFPYSTETNRFFRKPQKTSVSFRSGSRPSRQHRLQDSRINQI